MTHTARSALHWAATNPGWALAFTVLAVITSTIISARILAYRARAKKRRSDRLALAEADPEVADKRRAEVDRRRANAMTIVAASIASGMSLTGMWPVVTDAIKQAGITGDLQRAISVVLLGFIEVAVLASGLRARANVRINGTTGKDGIAMWVIVAFSAILGALEAKDATGVIVRLITPFGAAWLWERGLEPEREAHGTRQKLHWRVTTRRIAIFLRLAEPEDADLVKRAQVRRTIAIAKNVVRAQNRRSVFRRWSTWRVQRSLFVAIKDKPMGTEDTTLLIEQIDVLAATAHLIGRTPVASRHFEDMTAEDRATEDKAEDGGQAPVPEEDKEPDPTPPRPRGGQPVDVLNKDTGVPRMITTGDKRTSLKDMIAHPVVLPAAIPSLIPSPEDDLVRPPVRGHLHVVPPVPEEDDRELAGLTAVTSDLEDAKEDEAEDKLLTSENATEDKAEDVEDTEKDMEDTVEDTASASLLHSHRETSSAPSSEVPVEDDGSSSTAGDAPFEDTREDSGEDGDTSSEDGRTGVYVPLGDRQKDGPSLAHLEDKDLAVLAKAIDGKVTVRSLAAEFKIGKNRAQKIISMMSES